MADVLDKITDVRNAARPNSARVSSGRSAGGSTLSCDNLTGWPTASKVHFVTYQIDSNSNPVAGTQLDCYGIRSGNDITNFTVVDGTDSGNAVNDVVEMLPTAAWGQDLADALTAEHDRQGRHTDVTAESITLADAIDVGDSFLGIRDSSDNELLKFTKTTNAINEITVKNASVGTGPEVQATGADSNINLKLVPKGTGRVEVNGAGAAGTNTVATSQTTTSTSYTDLATGGPAATVTIGASGMALVIISATCANANASGYAIAGYAVSGANTAAATDAKSVLMRSETAAEEGNYCNTFLETGLTAGSTTFTMKYRCVSGTAQFQRRFITVIPL